MRIPPWVLLAGLLAILAVAALVSSLQRGRLKHILQGLAADWAMQYSSRDLFRLAARIAHRLPHPGAADVHIRDLMYASTPQGVQCLLTAEYTLGATSPNERLTIAVGLLDCPQKPPAEMPIHLADPNLPIVEQYRRVREKLHSATQLSTK